jgi:hypothetical protein
LVGLGLGFGEQFVGIAGGDLEQLGRGPVPVSRGATRAVRVTDETMVVVALAMGLGDN